MPYYPVHISASRHAPLPPVADVTTIDADSAEQALETEAGNLRRAAGVTSMWLKVVVGVWASGEARYVLSV